MDKNKPNSDFSSHGNLDSDKPIEAVGMDDSVAEENLKKLRPFYGKKRRFMVVPTIFLILFLSLGSLYVAANYNSFVSWLDKTTPIVRIAKKSLVNSGIVRQNDFGEWTLGGLNIFTEREKRLNFGQTPTPSPSPTPPDGESDEEDRSGDEKRERGFLEELARSFIQEFGPRIPSFVNPFNVDAGDTTLEEPSLTDGSTPAGGSNDLSGSDASSNLNGSSDTDTIIIGPTLPSDTNGSNGSNGSGSSNNGSNGTNGNGSSGNGSGSSGGTSGGGTTTKDSIDIAQERNRINNKVANSMFRLRMNLAPEFPDGKKGNINMVNTSSNKLQKQLTIVLDSTKTEIYSSQLIPPGSSLAFIELKQTLPKGVHAATATVKLYDMSSKHVWTTGAKLKLYVH